MKSVCVLFLNSKQRPDWLNYLYSEEAQGGEIRGRPSAKQSNSVDV